MERQKAAARPRRLCVCGLCVCGDGEAAAQVSIFFSDIRGFTALSESLPPSVWGGGGGGGGGGRFLPQPRGFKSRPCRSRNTPQELIELLGDYLESMSALIEESRGTVGKYIGDAIMVRPGAAAAAPARAPRGDRGP